VQNNQNLIISLSMYRSVHPLIPWEYLVCCARKRKKRKKKREEKRKGKSKIRAIDRSVRSLEIRTKFSIHSNHQFGIYSSLMFSIRNLIFDSIRVSFV